jgi:hypothetical protein
MARTSTTRPTKAEQIAAFLVALGQLEAVATDIDLNLSATARLDAIRRLSRLVRALRNAPAERGARELKG